MPNTAKIKQVKDIADKLKSAKSAALIQYQGLTANEIADLRAKIKQTGGRMEVVKNTLITRALKKFGIKLPEKLTGPTSITFCNDDDIAPLKEIDKVNQEKELTSFKYGIFDQKLLPLEDLKQMLTLPGKSTLISQFIGGLNNPLTRMLFALKYNQTRLVLALKAISEK